MKMLNKSYFLIIITLIAGCASTPDFDTTRVDKSLTPKSAITETGASGQTVLWGGIILDTQNLESSTEIEVLAYPLNTYYRPLADSDPMGRFIIHQQGYLEPTTYAQGRSVSVLGKVTEIRKGKVGDSSYTYPVIDSEQLHLWSRDSGKDRTSFHFGVGIQL